MSDPKPADRSPDNEEPSKPDTPPAPPAQATPTKPSRGRRWRRRIIAALLVVIGIALALRLTVRWTLPTVLSKSAASVDLDVRYDRLQLHLMGGDVGLWNVRVVPRGAPADAEPLLHAEYVRGDISVPALLAGRLHVLRAEVDGADVLLERTADGRIPLLDRLKSGPPSPPATRIDFTPPLVVEAIRLHKLKVRLRDAYVTPATDVTAWLDLRVSDLGVTGRRARFEADAWAADLVDSFRAAGEMQAAGQSLDAAATVSLRGLRPKALGKYLEPLGVRAVADTVSVELNVAASARPVTMPGDAAASRPAPPAGPAQGRPDAVAATITVEGVRVAANERDVVTVAKLRADVSELTPTSAHVASASVEGVRVSAARSAQGVLGACGFELVAPAAATSPPRPPTAVAASSTPPPPPQQPFALTVGELLARDVNATVRDEAVSPATELRVVARELTCKARGGGNALTPDATLDVAARLELPGVARAVSVDGAVQPFARRRTVEVSVRAEGIRPEALRPYLDAVRVRSLLNDASVSATVSASIEPAAGGGGGFVADGRLADVALTDGAELLTFAGVTVRHAAIDPANGRWRVEAVEVEGPSLEIRRNADGSVEAAGLRLTSMASAQVSSTQSSTAIVREPLPEPSAKAVNVAETPPPSFPEVEVGRLTWKGVRLKLTDEAAQRSSFEIGDAGVELSDLLLDLRPSATTRPTTRPKPGRLKLWLASPELAREFSVEGALVPAPGSLAADLRVRGRGVDLTRLASYLRPLGVEPVLRRGSLDAAIKAEVARDADRVRGTLDVSGVRLADGDRELLALKGLRIVDAAVSRGGIDVGSIDVVKPRVSVTREADGAFVAAGVRVRPTTRPAATAAAPSNQGVAPPASPAPGPAASQPAATAVSLGRLSVDGAQLDWEDRTVVPPARLSGAATVRADGVVIGRPAPPARFDVLLAGKDVADELKLAGTLDLTPDAPAATLHVTGRGLRAGPLAPYLPPGTEVSLADGRLRADVEASLKPSKQGGQALALQVTNVDYRDAAARPGDGAPAAPLLALKSFRVIAPRVDTSGGVIKIDEFSLAGLETRARRDEDGATRLLGLVLRPPASTPRPPDAPSDRAVTPTTSPNPSATTAPSTVTEQDVARLVAEARRPLPLVTLGKLDINAVRIEWADATRPGSKPIAVRDLRLRNLAPVAVGGSKAESQPPVKVELTASVDPLTPRVALLAEASPFATEPVVKLDLTASRISGQGVTELLPALADRIDGTKLTDGHFRTRVQVHAKYDRRGPRDFDLSRGVQLDVEVNGLALTDGENGRVLAGVEGLQCDALRVEPNTGLIHAKVLEVNKPMANASRDAEGIHLLGLVIKPASQGGPTTQPTVGVAPAAEVTPAEQPNAEIRVDRILITGVDATFVDSTSEPALRVPLNNLDVEVRGFTTRALTEPRPIRFSAVVGADKVTLPKRSKGAGVGGAVGDVAGLLGGKSRAKLSNVRETEDRELFSQITAAGNLTLYPAPAGYVKSSVSGLELAGFAGPASQAGVDLSGGVFDGTVEAYFRDDGSLDTRSRFVFTDLAVAEPANGPIARHLKLPAPLDAVLGALRDTDGSITVPLNVPVETGNVDTGAVTASAVGALGGIIATAIASAPAKAIGGVGDVVGLGAILAGGKQKAEIEPVELAFGTGDATLGSAERRALDRLVERMRKDDTIELTGRHELGSGDVDVVRARANPVSGDALELARAVRARKRELVAARGELASRAKVELASLPEGQASTTLAELRALDREIATAEDAADALFDLLRPGAERQAERRGRAAAVQLAQQRLAGVRDVLDRAAASARVPLAAERVRMANPQFNPSADLPAGGRVVVTVVRKKRQ